MMENTMSLRAYQKDIVKKALGGGNTIVVLPTGSGKTLIAAELIKQVGPPSLFLVPTILLVEQQAQAIRSWTGLRVGEFFGGVSLPEDFDVLVSTPKAFQMAQARGYTFLQWTSLRLAVFDEVHHVLKDHPYRGLALDLGRHIDSGKQAPNILVLTASLTYAVGAKQVESAVARISGELHIKVMATASENEMREAGFLGTRAEADVRIADVPGCTISDVLPQKERKPHLMHKAFFARIHAGAATVISRHVHEIVRLMEQAVKNVAPQFQSPLSQQSLKQWGEQAYKLARQTANPMFKSLEHWYEALRALVTSWEEGEDAAITFLRMNGEELLPQQLMWPQHLQQKLATFWSQVPQTFPRFEHLKDVLLYEQDTLLNSAREFRGLLFVQQRVTTHILEHLISNDTELASVFRPACLYATTSPATPSLSISPSKSKQNIAAFASGYVNLLITTTVAEEGMDIPSANCVVSFDPMINAVSLVQRRGRARQAESSFVALSEREDRRTEQLEQVERQQLAIVQTFEPGRYSLDHAKERTAQESRERNARGIVADFDGDRSSALSAMSLYCKKTKADLSEEYQQSDGKWRCTLTYRSFLRTVSASGELEVKKESKKDAAVLLMKSLQAQMRA